ncbi:M23 family metallopeptidase [Ureibacillus sinduriensis]|uniref:Peptidase M23 n=1 Tax=Ureibacillus sinduriensis BLB-1 = JCM 15800 TaxID=1384057 RepID=A0A0A3HY05_9BACL|nr:M23 family metallopeptidase [Ureibacillus sinduriensis]KGR77294.1 peptidase M23 [Ureibacillus sinduriensis BLB-1 = JCM 15800]
MVRHLVLLSIFLLIGTTVLSEDVNANEAPSREQVIEQRMSMYIQFQDHIVPWYNLAAIDQYERNIQAVRPDIPKRESTVAIQFSKESWAGALNPQPDDTSPFSIEYFGGLGLDGNGDGDASRDDDEDVIFTIANYLSQFGPTEEDFKLALYEYYQTEEAVNQILTIAKMYKHYDTIDLDTHVFPVPVRGYNYSYRGTWGANRGWGGRRIHEGTDIFAGYSTPVVSTSYGVVEVMGWNEFGGWRVGIRDNHNTYHYYAHLAYFNKDLKVGDMVEPGMLLGGVGSSGYGKEGTSGKFPPHLHYGMYKFNGRTEWAFDPYPSLVQWEKFTKQQRK